jgi:hypothetical protein
MELGHDVSERVYICVYAECYSVSISCLSSDTCFSLSCAEQLALNCLNNHILSQYPRPQVLPVGSADLVHVLLPKIVLAQ